VSTKQTWVIGTILQNLFSLYCVPAVRKYCIRNNLTIKALFVLDKALGHPHSLQELYPEIKVVSTSPNTCCDVQRMGYTAVSSSKQY
jgi:uncharacterized iron-regulated protein